ncbi:hypothetical protein VNO77_13109 [Canavalia gladiata]|uniref:RING-type domain-containing protein n=1 Tax=Canavalia gladiata TaxID=3824 RepID=A0AAN9M0N7_CANGL
MCASNIAPITSSTNTTPPSVPIGDTVSNHTTITVESHGSSLDDETTATVRYSSLELSKGKMSNSSSSSCGSCCSICLMDYKECDLLRLLPGCGHFFHVKCVDPWLRMNLTCPVCRRIVPHQ